MPPLELLIVFAGLVLLFFGYQIGRTVGDLQRRNERRAELDRMIAKKDPQTQVPPWS